MFHLFAGSTHYPQGGIEDFIGSYASVEDAKKVVEQNKWDWWQIADSNLQEVEFGWADD